MNQKLIFILVLAQIMLVFLLYIRLGIEKSRAVKAGSVDRKKAAINPREWPEHVIKVSNNIANQFEVPVIFYTLALILYVTEGVNEVILILSGVFVISRYIHAYFHITSNYVPYRFKAFLVGTLTLLFITIWQLFNFICEV